MSNFSQDQQSGPFKMRLFRYWKSGTFEVIIDGQPARIKCIAGSNESLHDAEQLCAQKAERVQKIIDGTVSREWGYDRPIREEIIREIDSDNVITRNYYGALILNTTSVTIFDIDDHKKSFWQLLGLKKFNKKAEIINTLRTLHHQDALPGTTWRIYETTKGIRLIVLGRYIEPDSAEFHKFSQQIGADSLYNMLCAKQNCYRARLTPKPFRMHINTIKYRCPVPEGEETRYREWVAEYERVSAEFGVCRLIETLGNSLADNSIVDLHDRYCLNESASRLA